VNTIKPTDQLSSIKPFFGKDTFHHLINLDGFWRRKNSCLAGLRSRYAPFVLFSWKPLTCCRSRCTTRNLSLKALLYLPLSNMVNLLSAVIYSKKKFHPKLISITTIFLSQVIAFISSLIDRTKVPLFNTVLILLFLVTISI
jgi:hypothetical protein